jgi:DNA-binding GntR family transcriptional regulator
MYREDEPRRCRGWVGREPAPQDEKLGMKKPTRRTVKSESAAEAPRKSRGLKLVRRETLKERIYQELRRALQDGKFEPGEAITVKLLEDELGAGSMPIRETVQRLVAEGALMNLPTGRVRVPLFTADEYDEIKEIRLRLEGLAVFNAASRMDAETLDEITARHNDLMAAALSASEDDWSEVIHLNYLFHFGIYEAAGGKHLVSMIDSLWLRVSPLLSIPFKHKGRVYDEWVLAHDDNQKRLLQALKDRDGRAAESAMREVILTSAAWYHRHHEFASS